MQLALITHQNSLRPALITQAGAHPLPYTAAQWPEILSQTLSAENRKQLEAQAGAPTKDFTYALPLTPTSKILCVGLNYLEHAREGKQAVPEHPVFFIRYPSSFVPHQAPLIAPKNSGKYDYEAELAIILGAPLRHATEAHALNAIAGYTAAMDGSVRDYQKRTPQWTMGKNFDASGALGPCLTTADALPKGASGLNISSTLNGETLQSDNTENMIFPVAKLLATLSEAMTLKPGDVILTGTPSGVGFARTPPIYLKPGDRITVSIEQLPPLENPVIAE